jgi:spore coat polysaccharide biosynthesis predicted glycosyltransferase SpsG
MNKRILFRIDNSENSGLGHISRSHGIGEQLEFMGYEVYYALDNSWPSEFAAIEPLAKRQVVLDSLHGQSEYEFLYSFMTRNEIPIMVLDSYKASIEWFDFFHRAQIRIFCLDDSNNHNDPRIYKIPYGIRYFGDRELPNLDVGAGALRNVVITAQGDSSIKLPKSTTTKRIFVYLGSNPQENEVKSVVSGVLRGLKNSELNIEMILIKSRFVSQDFLCDLFSEARLPPRVKLLLLDFCDGLLPVISSCDLVIGAANTIIYQTSACRIPQITFSLNPTQQNEDFQLEQIGHYFNLGNLDAFDDELFPKFLALTLNRLHILKTLLSDVNDRPGYAGARNAAIYIHSSLIKSNELSSNRHHREYSEERLSSSAVFTVRETKASDVNLILEGRNMESTRKYMIETKEISKPSHYAWWFTNHRENFIGLTGDAPCIYIWHEVREIRGEKFLIGGWTPVCKNLHFSTILEALNWQLGTTSVKYPGLKWLAAVHKDNSVTQFLVNRIGFKRANPESLLFDAALEMFFAGAPTDEYLLYSS